MLSTRVIPVDPDEPDPGIIAEAAKILREGGLVAFATETVYGLGVDATNPRAVARIFEAKGRPATNPLIVHVESQRAALACVANWPERAEILADRFWPGPLTLVLARSPIIPDLVTAGQDTVGIRVPRPEVARSLIRATGRPIAAPSANRSTGISPTSAGHVRKDLEGKVDLILDSGPTTLGLESTVLDLSVDRPRVLRPGELTREQIALVLGEPVDNPTERPDPAEAARSPGQMDLHYSPRTPAYRVEHPPSAINGPGEDWALITFGPSADRPNLIGDLAPSLHVHLETPADAARSLYAVLHDCDDRQFDYLAIIPPPDEPRWRAILDRIKRATRPFTREIP